MHVFQIEKTHGRDGSGTEEMRILQKSGVLADQEKKGSGRNGGVLEHRADRRPLELLDAGVVARRSDQGWQRQRQRQRRRLRREQNHRVHDNRQPRPRWYSGRRRDRTAASAGGRGRRANGDRPEFWSTHGHRDEREPHEPGRTAARQAQAREKRVAGGETRTESGQDTGHHHRRVRRVLVAVFHHGPGHAPVPGVQDQ